MRKNSAEFLREGFALAHWSALKRFPAVRSRKEAIPYGIARKSPRMSPIFDLQSADGKLYMFPTYDINRDVNHGMLYRKDIFDKHGIKMWNSPEEFYNVLKHNLKLPY